jgi:hypothetical protein
MFLEEQLTQKSEKASKEQIQNIRVLRGPKANEYLIALKLTSSKAVANFINLVRG